MDNSTPPSVPRMDDTEGLVRLIIESFRDASNPSVDIAVEEIMRTFDDAISEARAEGARKQAEADRQTVRDFHV